MPKYFKRIGSKGHYRYFYTKEQFDKYNKTNPKINKKNDDPKKFKEFIGEMKKYKSAKDFADAITMRNKVNLFDVQMMTLRKIKRRVDDEKELDDLMKKHFPEKYKEAVNNEKEQKRLYDILKKETEKNGGRAPYMNELSQNYDTFVNVYNKYVGGNSKKIPKVGIRKIKGD